MDKDAEGVSVSEEEEEMIDRLFFQCDIHNEGRVKVQTVIQFLTNCLGNENNEGDLQKLSDILEAENQDGSINISSYRHGVTRWITQIKSRCTYMDGDTMFEQISSHDGLNCEGNSIGRSQSQYSIEASGVCDGSYRVEHDAGELLSRIDDLKFQNHRLSEENTKLYTQLETQEESVSTLATELSSKRHEADTLKKKIKSLQEVTDQQKGLLEENEELKVRLASLQEGRRQLDRRLADLEEEKQATDSQAKLFECMWQKAKGELDQAAEQLHILNTSLSEQKMLLQAKDTKDSMALQEKEVANLTEKLKEAMAQNEKLQEGKNEVEERLTKVNSKYLRVQSKVEQLGLTEVSLTEEDPQVDFSNNNSPKVKFSTPCTRTSICMELMDQLNEDKHLGSPLCEMADRSSSEWPVYQRRSALLPPYMSVWEFDLQPNTSLHEYSQDTQNTTGANKGINNNSVSIHSLRQRSTRKLRHEPYSKRKPYVDLSPNIKGDGEDGHMSTSSKHAPRQDQHKPQVGTMNKQRLFINLTPNTTGAHREATNLSTSNQQPLRHRSVQKLRHEPYSKRRPLFDLSPNKRVATEINSMSIGNKQPLQAGSLDQHKLLDGPGNKQRRLFFDLSLNTTGEANSLSELDTSSNKRALRRRSLDQRKLRQETYNKRRLLVNLSPSKESKSTSPDIYDRDIERRLLQLKSLEKGSLQKELIKQYRVNLDLAERCHKAELRETELHEEMTKSDMRREEESVKCQQLEESLVSIKVAQEGDIRDLWKLIHCAEESNYSNDDSQKPGEVSASTELLQLQIKKEIEALRHKLDNREAPTAALKSDPAGVWHQNYKGRICSSPLVDALNIESFHSSVHSGKPHHYHTEDHISCVDCLKQPVDYNSNRSLPTQRRHNRVHASSNTGPTYNPNSIETFDDNANSRWARPGDFVGKTHSSNFPHRFTFDQTDVDSFDSEGVITPVADQLYHTDPDLDPAMSREPGVEEGQQLFRRRSYIKAIEGQSGNNVEEVNGEAEAGRNRRDSFQSAIEQGQISPTGPPQTALAPSASSIADTTPENESPDFLVCKGTPKYSSTPYQASKPVTKSVNFHPDTFSKDRVAAQNGDGEVFLQDHGEHCSAAQLKFTANIPNKSLACNSHNLSVLLEEETAGSSPAGSRFEPHSCDPGSRFEPTPSSYLTGSSGQQEDLSSVEVWTLSQTDSNHSNQSASVSSRDSGHSSSICTDIEECHTVDMKGLDGGGEHSDQHVNSISPTSSPISGSGSTPPVTPPRNTRPADSARDMSPSQRILLKFGKPSPVKQDSPINRDFSPVKLFTPLDTDGDSKPVKLSSLQDTDQNSKPVKMSSSLESDPDCFLQQQPVSESSGEAEAVSSDKPQIPESVLDSSAASEQVNKNKNSESKARFSVDDEPASTVSSVNSQAKSSVDVNTIAQPLVTSQSINTLSSSLTKTSNSDDSDKSTPLKTLTENSGDLSSSVLNKSYAAALESLIQPDGATLSSVGYGAKSSGPSWPVTKPGHLENGAVNARSSGHEIVTKPGQLENGAVKGKELEDFDGNSDAVKLLLAYADDGEETAISFKSMDVGKGASRDMKGPRGDPQKPAEMPLHGGGKTPHTAANGRGAQTIIMEEDERETESPGQGEGPKAVSNLAKIRQSHLAKRRGNLGQQSKMPQLSELAEKENNDERNQGPPGAQDIKVVDGENSRHMTNGDVVMPSLPDSFLKKLGLVADEPSSEELSEQEIENKFSSLSLAFKTDAQTLEKRLEIQERSRDIAEQNVDRELQGLRNGLATLNQICTDPQVREVLAKIQTHIEILEKSTARVSSRAEVYGAIQQEKRMSRAVDIMVQHVENLRRVHEREHAELEEARKLLQDSRSLGPSTLDIAGGDMLSRRSASVCPNNMFGGKLAPPQGGIPSAGAVTVSALKAIRLLKASKRRVSEVALPKVLGGSGAPNLHPSSSMDLCYLEPRRSLFPLRPEFSLDEEEGSVTPAIHYDPPESTLSRNLDKDARSRFQAAVASTTVKNTITNTLRRTSLEKQGNVVSVSPSPTPPQVSRDNSADSGNKSVSVDVQDKEKQKNMEEEAYKKGYEQGLRASLGKDLTGLREQQNQINQSLGQIMDTIDGQMDEPKSLKEIVTERFNESIPKIQISGWRIRMTLGVCCIIMAFISIFIALFPGSSAHSIDR